MSVGGEARGEDERIVQPYMTIESVASLPPNLLDHEPRRHTYTPAARGACVPRRRRVCVTTGLMVCLLYTSPSPRDRG